MVVEDDNDYQYVPPFSDKVRTVIYVLGLIASVVALGFVAFGDPAIGAYISTVAGIIASGTGVLYNPISMGDKLMKTPIVFKTKE